MPLLALKTLSVNLCRDGPSADLKVIGRKHLREHVRAPDASQKFQNPRGVGSFLRMRCWINPLLLLFSH